MSSHSTNRTCCLGVIVVIAGLWLLALLSSKGMVPHKRGYKWHQAHISGVNRATAIAVSPTGAAFVCFDEGGIYRSVDGKHWQAVNNGIKECDIHSIAFGSNGVVYAGTGRGIYRSVDNGDHWETANTGLPLCSVLTVAVDSKDRIYAGTNEGKLFRSKDKGNHWKSVNTDNRPIDMGDIYSILITSDQRIFIGCEHTGIYRSDDGGSTWANVYKVSEDDYCNVGSLIVGRKGKLFAEDNARLLRSVDNAKTWNKLDLGNIKILLWNIEDIRCWDIAIAPDGRIIASTNQGLMESADDGKTWKSMKLKAKTFFPGASYIPPINCVTVDSKGWIFAVSRREDVFCGIPGSSN